jgi:acyl-CoA synthetase (AMP-forming)/AMP-acid ligase II
MVAALVVKRPGLEVTPAEIIQFSRQLIAAYKAPRFVSFVPSLPKNPAGKILKHELRSPYWAGHSRRVN